MTVKESRRETLIRKAREAREQAAGANDPWVRQSLEEIARGYEVLAEKEPDDESGESGADADV
jgi:hypothetical protein